MHIPQHNNNNQAIVDCNNDIVPLCYFNIIKLKAGESYTYQLADYETCIVPATGSIDVEVQGETFKEVGKRQHIWEGDPEGVYVPVSSEAKLTCILMTDLGVGLETYPNLIPEDLIVAC